MKERNMNIWRDFYYGNTTIKNSLIEFFYSYVFAIMHVALGILCFIFHFWILTGYNVVAIALYFFVYKANKNNQINRMYKMVFYDLSQSVIFLNLAFGWDYGFYLYLFGVPASTFYCVYYMRTQKLKDFSPIRYCLLAALFIIFCYLTSLYAPANEWIHNSVIRPYIFIFNCFVLFSTSIFILLAFFSDIKKTEALLDEKNRLLEVLASTDALTRVLNRRSMEEHLRNALEKFRENGTPFCLVISDIDNFKLINDKYGHAIGDKVLIEVTRIFNQEIKKEDYICRWGGEEFLILLTNSKILDAMEIVERLRKGIEMGKVYFSENEFCQFTMTFGMAEFHENSDIDKILIEIDKKLYQGKLKNKNCIIV